MNDHRRGPGFFSAIAATAILGSQCLLLAAERGIAVTLWLAALALWCGLIYAIFAAFTIKERKPSLGRGVDGGWLLAVVATQSIAVLASLLAAGAGPGHRDELDFLGLSFWLGGGMLYVWISALIFQRHLFFPLPPADLGPTYWISMGAMAISTLAGSQLVADAPGTPLLEPLLPFLRGGTVACWATGSWWIPLLLMLTVWRHAIRRVPLRYDAQWWGAVFPLGMYAEATDRMAAVLPLGFLSWLPGAFWIAAVVGWLAAAAGLVRTFRHRRR